MKLAVSFPFAVVAALLVPRPKHQEEVTVQMERSLAKQESRVKAIRAMQEKLKAGESVSLEKIFEGAPKSTSAEEIQKIRQEIVSLQQEYESFPSVPAWEIPLSKPSSEEQKLSDVVKPNPAVQSDPYRLGNALFRSGKYEEAWEKLSKQKDPWSALLAATCLERMGRFEDASGAYKKIVEQYPKTPAAEQAAKIQIFVGKRSQLGRVSDYDNSIAALTKLLQEQAEEKKK